MIECLASLTVDERHACRLLGAAAAARAHTGEARFAIYQPAHDEVVARLRNTLGEQDFDASWADGATLSVEGDDRIRAARPLRTQTPGNRLVHVLATVKAATSQFAPRQEDYPIALKVSSGRWSVAALDYAPLLAPDAELTPVIPTPVAANAATR